MSLINVVTYKSTMTCKLTIHLPPSRNCSLKYTSALAANANNAAETNGNNVIICILLICGIKPATLPLSLSCSRSAALGVYPCLWRSAWLHRCLSFIGPQLTPSTNHKRPRSEWLAFTPDIVSASCAVLRPAVTVHDDLRSRHMTGQYRLRISF